MMPDHMPYSGSQLLLGPLVAPWVVFIFDTRAL
jgi:hypothetical protein